MSLEWASTVPNPRGPGYGVDGDQRGWKLHIVDTDKLYQATPKAPVFGAALCGTRAKHGWGVDSGLAYLDRFRTNLSSRHQAFGLVALSQIGEART